MKAAEAQMGAFMVGLLIVLVLLVAACVWLVLR